MSVSDYFSTFCSNLRMDSDTVSTIQSPDNKKNKFGLLE